MANREAIRDLQARLASRLQAVQEGANPVQWLAVYAGPKGYLLPLAQAGEIYSLSGLQAVPRTQPWFLGVLNVRGSLYGVADLHGFLTWGQGMEGVPTKQTSVVTLNPTLEVNCALSIAALAGLRSPGDFASVQEGAPENLPWQGKRYTDAQGAIWQEINLQALSVDSGFLTISA